MAQGIDFTEEVRRPDLRAALVSSFRDTGYRYIGDLTERQLAETWAFLKSREVFNGRHVVQADTTGFSSWEDAAAANVICWRMGDAVLAPHLLEFALAWTDFAAEYLGVATPLLYSMNVFTTRPGEIVRPDIQDWHKDSDDVRFMPMFFYLSDVGDDGAQELRNDAGEIIAHITGPAGTVFLSDTMRDHRGLKPQNAERTIAWARWGVSDPPPSYVWDRLESIDKALLGDRYPTDARLQESIKLIVR